MKTLTACDASGRPDPVVSLDIFALVQAIVRLFCTYSSNQPLHDPFIVAWTPVLQPLTQFSTLNLLVVQMIRH